MFVDEGNNILARNVFAFSFCHRVQGTISQRFLRTELLQNKGLRGLHFPEYPGLFAQGLLGQHIIDKRISTRMTAIPASNVFANPFCSLLPHHDLYFHRHTIASLYFPIFYFFSNDISLWSMIPISSTSSR